MVDAIQAFDKIPLGPRDLGVSFMSLSGHKIYAPKGVGALYVDPSVTLAPLIHGGDQERRRRAGTENVVSIAAMGLAAKLAHAERAREQARLRALRDRLLNGLRQAEPGLIVNGALDKRLPNNLNLAFEGIDSGSLLLSLNRIGVYVSAGSACHAGSVEASHVIRALGLNTERYGTIRLSLGLKTDEADVDYVCEHLPRLLAALREEKHKAA